MARAMICLLLVVTMLGGQAGCAASKATRTAGKVMAGAGGVLVIGGVAAFAGCSSDQRHCRGSSSVDDLGYKIGAGLLGVGVVLGVAGLILFLGPGKGDPGTVRNATRDLSK